MYIYLDESGDLGTKLSGGSSAYFIITIVVCYTLLDKKKLHNAIERTKKNKKIFKEIKGTNTSKSVKEYFLKQLSGADFEIYSIIFDKSKHESSNFKSRASQIRLYATLSSLVIDQIPFSSKTTNINVYIDRSSLTNEIEYNSYLENYIAHKYPLNVPVYFEHVPSQNNSGLQVVDLFNWGIFRKYQKKDISWYSSFKNKILYEEFYKG